MIRERPSGAVALDFACQLADALFGAGQVWMDLVRKAIGFKRALLVPQPVKHEAKPGNGLEMAGLQHQRLRNVLKRLAVVFTHEMDSCAHFPTLGEIGRETRKIVKKAKRYLKILLL